MTNNNNHSCHNHESNHEHSPSSIEAMVEIGLKRFKDAGFKMTKKRKEILEYFAKEDRYVSALDVHKHMVEKYPTLSYNTTYRNLYDFVETGLLEGTEYNQEQMFRFACSPDSNHHHHHFICTSCGVTIPLDACPMSQVTTDLSMVTIESHRFEVFGKCANCSEVLRQKVK